jgi:hypothetical protein
VIGIQDIKRFDLDGMFCVGKLCYGSDLQEEEVGITVQHGVINKAM